MHMHGVDNRMLLTLSVAMIELPQTCLDVGVVLGRLCANPDGVGCTLEGKESRPSDPTYLT